LNSISVVMPCYKGESVISHTLERTAKTLSKITEDYEIILVVDGNLDKTFEIAQKIAEKNPRIRPFTYGKNLGKGYALQYGSQFITKDITAFIDSDLDLPPEQLKIFLRFIKARHADVVIGSKRHPLSKVKYPMVRRFLSWCYSAFLKIFFRLNVSDTQVGFKVMKSEVAKTVMPRIIVKRFAFDLEFLVVANKFGFRIEEAPVIVIFKNFPSNIDWKQIWHIFIDTLAIFYRLNITKYYDRRVDSK